MTKIQDELRQRRRLGYFKLAVVAFGLVLVGRLGYLQIALHGKYQAQAAQEHTRKYEIPARRGQLYVHDGNQITPVVLNQQLNALHVDPRYVGDKAEIAQKLAALTGGDIAVYQHRIEIAIEDAVLDRRISNDLAAKIKALNLGGVWFTQADYRTYPEGSLAAQVLGFVNSDGVGQYGVEGYLDSQLGGTPGQLAAKTDTRGVPIATADNIVKPPVDGKSYALTVDRNIQAMAEQELATQVARVKAKSGSIVVMDLTGEVRAMANFPTYDPNNYGVVSDYSVFINQAVTSQFEPGSGMKAFTMAVGLDQGKVKPDTKYNDDGCVQVGDRKVCNAQGDKPGMNKTMLMVLRDSLNTGVVFVLKMLGGNPDAITGTGKRLLYDYFSKHFGYGVRTGIEQAGEAAGVLPKPTTNDVTYANMTFGQGMSVTMIQMTSAMAAVANGGTLYQPRVVEGAVQTDGTVAKSDPKIVNAHVLGADAIRDLTSMLVTVVEHGSGYQARVPGYANQIAGKTGTAQIAKADGTGYQEGANIGSFVGFAPVSNPRFVLMVRINEPQINGFAEVTTVPVFRDVCEWLFKYYSIPPSS